MYQDGLSEKQWNPTQCVYEICAHCGWLKPEYTEVSYIFGQGFLYEVVVNGQTFRSERWGKNKKLAQHLSSTRFLHFIGFVFNYDPPAQTTPIYQSAKSRDICANSERDSKVLGSSHSQCCCSFNGCHFKEIHHHTIGDCLTITSNLCKTGKRSIEQSQTYVFPRHCPRSRDFSSSWSIGLKSTSYFKQDLSPSTSCTERNRDFAPNKNVKRRSPSYFKRELSPRTSNTERRDKGLKSSSFKQELSPCCKRFKVSYEHNSQ